MDRQTFLESVNQPQRLVSVPLNELQALALEYPYSPNLRLLILLKSILEGHPEEEAYLSRCAAAMFDRAHLYDLVQDIRTLADGEETLELRDLEELMLPAKAPIAPPEELAMETQIPTSEPGAAGGAGIDEERELPMAAVADPPSGHLPEGFSTSEIDEWVALAASFVTVMPTFSETGDIIPEAIRPEKPEKFLAKQRPTGVPSTLSDRLKRLRKLRAQQSMSTEEKVTAIARHSVTTHGAVASETLAKLLVQQGQYQNAIKMYQRLELLYPEKKTIFAGLINELKEKL
jgi:hypothetical protein